MKHLTKNEIAQRIIAIHHLVGEYWTLPVYSYTDNYTRDELIEMHNNLVLKNGIFDRELIE